MMNRGVMDRQMFRGVEFKQAGGPAGIMAAAPGMAGGMAQAGMPEDAAAVAAGSMDPAVLEQMLGSAQQSISNLDEAEDFETVINSIRGDEAPLEARYEELADIVGPEDAGETPESVLALLQPVIMMNALDEGIGGLAQQEMTQPVEGDMAGGIMSTVAEPPPEEMPPMGMEGPPPVNFNKGGLVRRGDNQPVQYFNAGGTPVTRFFGPRVDISPAQSQLLRQRIDYENMAKELAKAKAAPSVTPLTEAFEGKRGAFRSLLGDTSGDSEERRRLAQGQALLDLANTFLAFSAPMEGERSGMSPAERLAMAARSTKLPQMISARAQSLFEAEQAAKKEGRALDLAALEAANKQVEAEREARAKYRQKQMELEQKTQTLGEGEVLLSSTGEVLARGQKKPEKGFTLKKGEKRFDASGKEIAEGPTETYRLKEGEVVKDAFGNIIAKGLDKDLVDDDIRYMTDPERLDAYANNTLGGETGAFEGTILKFVNKSVLQWDGNGYVPTGTPQLSPRILAAMEAREAAGFPSILGQLPEGVVAPVSRRPEGAGAAPEPKLDDSGAGTGAAPEPKPEAVKIPKDITSAAFNKLIFTGPNNSVNLESPAWDAIPTNIVDKDLNYPGSTGIASGYPRLKNYFRENLREVGGAGLTEEGKKLSRADADIVTLRNEILTYNTTGGLVADNDRILKMVQEQLMQETNKLTPGMWTSDESALSKLLSTEEKLAANFQVLAQRVPEYGGSGRNFTKEQVTQARARLSMLKNMIAEVRTMRKIYERALNEGALGLNPTQRKIAKEWLQGKRSNK